MIKHTFQSASVVDAFKEMDFGEEDPLQHLLTFFPVKEAFLKN